MYQERIAAERAVHTRRKTQEKCLIIGNSQRDILADLLPHEDLARCRDTLC